MDLYDALKEIGVKPWISIKDLNGGDLWQDKIENELPKSDAVVVLLHPGFDECGYRQAEVHKALETMRSKPPGRAFIIPFIVEP